MPRPKTILQRIEVDVAGRAHNCQHNTRHRVQRGDRRLKVHTNRSAENFCVACGLEIIERDIARLQKLASELRGDVEVDVA